MRNDVSSEAWAVIRSAPERLTSLFYFTDAFRYVEFLCIGLNEQISPVSHENFRQAYYTFIEEFDTGLLRRFHTEPIDHSASIGAEIVCAFAKASGRPVNRLPSEDRQTPFGRDGVRVDEMLAVMFGIETMLCLFFSRAGVKYIPNRRMAELMMKGALHDLKSGRNVAEVFQEMHAYLISQED